MPFCKMCFDLGRPDFDKHNVRDSARNTTCPYLLNTKCKNCGYSGHSSSYCKMQRHLKSVLQKPAPKHIEIIKPVTKPKNAFELLCMEVDDDEDVKKEEVEEDEEDEEELPHLSNVQWSWGKGLGKKSWADQVEEDEDELPSLSNVQWGEGLPKKSYADEVEDEELRTWVQIVAM